MLIRKDGKTYGTIGGDELQRIIVNEALKAIKEGQPKLCSYDLLLKSEGGIGMPCGGRVELFIDVIKPSSTLIIVGSGYVAQPLAKLAKFLGFQVIVVDPQAKPEDFKEVDQVIKSSVDTAILENKISLNSETYVAIVGRYDQDIPALKATINSNAKYVGLIGSKRRIALALEQLEKEGFKINRDKLHAPIGINIEAETPEEIAVSILAEIIKVKNSVS
jgi:xanthine dehydrogenase accessory factor